MRDVEVNVLSIGVSTFVVLVLVLVSASSCISLMLVKWCSLLLSLSSGEHNETDAVIIGGDVNDDDCNCCVLISDAILV
jgi:hypothetical protein